MSDVQDVFVGGRRLGKLEAYPLFRRWRETVQGRSDDLRDLASLSRVTSLVVRLVSAEC